MHILGWSSPLFGCNENKISWLSHMESGVSKHGLKWRWFDMTPIFGQEIAASFCHKPKKKKLPLPPIFWPS